MNNIFWHLSRPYTSLRHPLLSPRQLTIGGNYSYWNVFPDTKALLQNLPFSTKVPMDIMQPSDKLEEKPSSSASYHQSGKKRQRHGSSSSTKSDYKKYNGKHKWIERRWISHGEEADYPTGLDFSVMSYNVLAQDLLEEHSHMYGHCDSKYLSWGYRKTKLIDDIRYYRPDVVCLQEVQANHYYTFFDPQMKRLGYRGDYKKRTHEKVDGCATFYNERKFTVELVQPVEYFNKKLHILDRDNVGLVVLLKLKLPRISPRKQQDSQQRVGTMSEARLCVANTHLLFNPRRGDVKLAQLCKLFAEIDKIAAKPGFSGYHPVILCGDFNFCPKSPLYDFVVGKKMTLQKFTGQDLSGQKESQRGNNIALSPNSLPPRMGIFDQCQYMNEVAKRHEFVKKTQEVEKSAKSDNVCNQTDAEKLGGRCDDDNQIQKETADGVTSELKTEGKGTDNNNTEKHDKPVVKKKANSLGSGVLSNNFNLVSVYGDVVLRCGRSRYPTVTTKHGSSESTVDFMFYSVEEKLAGVDNCCDPKHKLLITEADLKLVKKLDLYSSKDARDIGGFPSRYYPSDHIPLVVSFKLCY